MSTGRVEIEYCRQCRFLLRAAWLAQELLTTFESELGEVALLPGQGGVFEVRLDGEVIFARSAAGRFPRARNSSSSCATASHRASRWATATARRHEPLVTRMPQREII